MKYKAARSLGKKVTPHIGSKDIIKYEARRSSLSPGDRESFPPARDSKGSLQITREDYARIQIYAPNQRR